MTNQEPTNYDIMIRSDVAIIGGGLTGLTLQYLLNKEGIPTIIIEARSRLGGRIYTTQKDDAPPIDMGATWLGMKHTQLNALLKELGLDIFAQVLGEHAIYEPISTSPHQLVTLPANDNPSYRIKGGTSTLIKTLSEHIRPQQLFDNQVITSIKEGNDGLVLESKDKVFKAKMVVSTVPPYLFQKTVGIEPHLPDDVQKVMDNTHTWMGESIKIGLVYSRPFWRESGMSGTVFSNVGPIPELYDHSNDADNLYALKGFLNGNYHSVSKEDRLNIILKQLRKYYGNVVDEYTDYQELVWCTEPYTFTKYSSHILPHQNNGHPLYRQAYLNDRLYIAGSETSAHFSGYMEGAVCSAYHVFNQIKKWTITT